MVGDPLGGKSDANESLRRERAARRLQMGLWAALSFVVFLSFLLYLETDGCLEPECEAAIRARWLPLMGVQTTVSGAAVLLQLRTKLISLAAALALSIVALVVYVNVGNVDL